MTWKIDVHKGTVIAVDFDNTLAYTEYPRILRPRQNIVNFINLCKDRGATIILWTCRCGKPLRDALKWCGEHGVPIDYVNCNLPEYIRCFGSDSRKIWADYYIDDRNIPDRLIGEKYPTYGVRLRTARIHEKQGKC